MAHQRKSDRIAFLPSRRARQYLDALVKRLTDERGLFVRVTLREAFDLMVDYAQAGEALRQAELKRVRGQK